jgi:ATP-dependent DNA helicase RecG
MTQKTIETLLSMDENQTFETKRALKKPSEVLPTICAFANGDGGVFVYGMADKKHCTGKLRLTGINEGNSNHEELLKLIASNFTPPLPNVIPRYFDITNTQGTNDKLLVVAIDSSKAVHSLMSGQTYLRRGSQNNLLTHEQAMQLQYEKGATSFESETAEDVSIEMLDKTIVDEFMSHNKSKENDIGKFFVKNGLAKEKHGKIFLNNAAVLLFAENPSVVLRRKCGIKIVHYMGLTQISSGKPNFHRMPFTIEGNLLLQINKAFEYIKDNALPVMLEGTAFKRLKIPEFVLQEAIVNGVIHRDYSIQDNIQIRIFDNRIEVESPGWFPGFVKPETILNERFARNPIIERTLNRMPEPPNLDIGEGVNRMFNEMRKKNLHEPLYLSRKDTPHSVCVILLNEEKIGYWDIIDKFLSQHRQVSNREFCELTGLDTLKASELLKKWTKQKLLEKTGDSKKTTSYKKPAQEGPKQIDLLE